MASQGSQSTDAYARMSREEEVKTLGRILTNYVSEVGADEGKRQRFNALFGANVPANATPMARPPAETVAIVNSIMSRFFGVYPNETADMIKTFAKHATDDKVKRLVRACRAAAAENLVNEPVELGLRNAFGYYADDDTNDVPAETMDVVGPIGGGGGDDDDDDPNKPFTPARAAREMIPVLEEIIIYMKKKKEVERFNEIFSFGNGSDGVLYNRADIRDGPIKEDTRQSIILELFRRQFRVKQSDADASSLDAVLRHATVKNVRALAAKCFRAFEAGLKEDSTYFKNKRMKPYIPPYTPIAAAKELHYYIDQWVTYGIDKKSKAVKFNNIFTLDPARPPYDFKVVRYYPVSNNDRINDVVDTVFQNYLKFGDEVFSSAINTYSKYATVENVRALMKSCLEFAASGTVDPQYLDQIRNDERFKPYLPGAVAEPSSEDASRDDGDGDAMDIEDAPATPGIIADVEAEANSDDDDEPALGKAIKIIYAVLDSFVAQLDTERKYRDFLNVAFELDTRYIRNLDLDIIRAFPLFTDQVKHVTNAIVYYRYQDSDEQFENRDYKFTVDDRDTVYDDVCENKDGAGEKLVRRLAKGCHVALGLDIVSINQTSSSFASEHMLPYLPKDGDASSDAGSDAGSESSVVESGGTDMWRPREPVQDDPSIPYSPKVAASTLYNIVEAFIKEIDAGLKVDKFNAIFSLGDNNAPAFRPFQGKPRAFRPIDDEVEVGEMADRILLYHLTGGHDTAAFPTRWAVIDTIADADVIRAFVAKCLRAVEAGIVSMPADLWDPRMKPYMPTDPMDIVVDASPDAAPRQEDDAAPADINNWPRHEGTLVDDNDTDFHDAIREASSPNPVDNQTPPQTPPVTSPEKKKEEEKKKKKKKKAPPPPRDGDEGEEKAQKKVRDKERKKFFEKTAVDIEARRPLTQKEKTTIRKHISGLTRQFRDEGKTHQLLAAWRKVLENVLDLLSQEFITLTTLTIPKKKRAVPRDAFVFADTSFLAKALRKINTSTRAVDHMRKALVARYAVVIAAKKGANKDTKKTTTTGKDRGFIDRVYIKVVGNVLEGSVNFAEEDPEARRTAFEHVAATLIDLAFLDLLRRYIVGTGPEAVTLDAKRKIKGRLLMDIAARESDLKKRLDDKTTLLQNALDQGRGMKRVRETTTTTTLAPADVEQPQRQREEVEAEARQSNDAMDIDQEIVNLISESSSPPTPAPAPEPSSPSSSGDLFQPAEPPAERPAKRQRIEPASAPSVAREQGDAVAVVASETTLPDVEATLVAFVWSYYVTGATDLRELSDSVTCLLAQICQVHQPRHWRTEAIDSALGNLLERVVNAMINSGQASDVKLVLVIGRRIAASRGGSVSNTIAAKAIKRFERFVETQATKEKRKFEITDENNTGGVAYFNDYRERLRRLLARTPNFLTAMSDTVSPDWRAFKSYDDMQAFTRHVANWLAYRIDADKTAPAIERLLNATGAHAVNALVGAAVDALTLSRPSDWNHFFSKSVRDRHNKNTPSRAAELLNHPAVPLAFILPLLRKVRGNGKLGALDEGLEAKLRDAPLTNRLAELADDTLIDLRTSDVKRLTEDRMDDGSTPLVTRLSYAYQEDAVRWMLARTYEASERIELRGGCVAAAMGLGKMVMGVHYARALQTMAVRFSSWLAENNRDFKDAYLAENSGDGPSRSDYYAQFCTRVENLGGHGPPVLIIAPASTIGQWEAEARAQGVPAAAIRVIRAPLVGDDVLDFAAPAQSSGRTTTPVRLVIMSHAHIPSSFSDQQRRETRTVTWTVGAVLVDDAHLLKPAHVSTLRTWLDAHYSTRSRSDRRLYIPTFALTASPIERDKMDLHRLFVLCGLMPSGAELHADTSALYKSMLQHVRNDSYDDWEANTALHRKAIYTLCYTRHTVALPSVIYKTRTFMIPEFDEDADDVLESTVSTLLDARDAFVNTAAFDGTLERQKQALVLDSYDHRMLDIDANLRFIARFFLTRFGTLHALTQPGGDAGAVASTRTELEAAFTQVLGNIGAPLPADAEGAVRVPDKVVQRVREAVTRLHEFIRSGGGNQRNALRDAEERVQRAVLAELSPELTRLIGSNREAMETWRKAVLFTANDAQTRLFESLLTDNARLREHVIFMYADEGVRLARTRERFDRFADANARPPPSLLVGSYDAIGTGTNLQAASVLYLLQPPEDLTVISQAIGRAVRQGQAAPEVVVEFGVVAMRGPLGTSRTWDGIAVSPLAQFSQGREAWTSVVRYLREPVPLSEAEAASLDDEQTRFDQALTLRVHAEAEDVTLNHRELSLLGEVVALARQTSAPSLRPLETTTTTTTTAARDTGGDPTMTQLWAKQATIEALKTKLQKELSKKKRFLDHSPALANVLEHEIEEQRRVMDTSEGQRAYEKAHHKLDKLEEKLEKRQATAAEAERLIPVLTERVRLLTEYLGLVRSQADAWSKIQSTFDAKKKTKARQAYDERSDAVAAFERRRPDILRDEDGDDDAS